MNKTCWGEPVQLTLAAQSLIHAGNKGFGFSGYMWYEVDPRPVAVFLPELENWEEKGNKTPQVWKFEDSSCVLAVPPRFEFFGYLSAFAFDNEEEVRAFLTAQATAGEEPIFWQLFQRRTKC